MRRKVWMGFVALLLVMGLAVPALAGNLAFTASPIPQAARQNAGTLFQIRGTATFSSSYATAGDTLTPASVGLGIIVWVDAPALDTTAQRFVTVTQPTVAAPTTKIECYTALNTECGNGTNQGAYSFPVTVWGF